jgi:16S rRNA (uracil1498-N3)-methyltransferase
MPATPNWPPKSAPRLFVEGELCAGQLRSLGGNAAHYLGSVMRRTTGDPVLLCDNISGEWLALVSEVGKRRVTLTVERQLRPREAVPDLWLCASPLKKPHFDMVLEKATELGVDRIMPVTMARSVADKVNAERAQTIVTEAAEQCARTALPTITAVQTLKALLLAWPADRHLFFADEDGGAPALAAVTAHPGPAALLIGPEGGFTDEERAAIRVLPQTVAVTLGPRILRAETAAITMTSLWTAAEMASGRM